MVSDTAVDSGRDAEVMAAVDAAAARPEFVVADVSREDAWLSVRADEASVLADWR